MAKKIDAQTLELLTTVRAKKAEIAAIQTPIWRTNNTFPDPNLGLTNNLHAVKHVAKLLAQAASLLVQADSYQAVCTRLNVENPPPFLWGGFSLEDWLHDFDLQIKFRQLREKQASLAKLEERLNAIISPELRRELELKAVTAELKAT